MLRLLGNSFTCCDGIPRRSFLRLGALGLGGITLADYLAYQAKAGQKHSGKGVIFVELAGGPTHMETYDPKPAAPIEYRGPLSVVNTVLPGEPFSELMVEQAKIADKLAVIRSIHHDSSSHGTSSHLTQTGYYLRNRQNRNNEMPCIGSVASRVLGPNVAGLPAYVGLQRTMRFGEAAYLGKAYNPFSVRNDPNRSNFKVDNLGLARGLDYDRVGDRRSLLQELDEHRRLADTRGVAEAVDKFTLEAFDLVTSGRAQKAFAIEEEPATVRDRYGRNRNGQEFLLARRLIEAGVTFVSVRVGGWDDHRGIEARMKSKGPDYDRALSALVEDVYARGLDRDLLIVVMGEFGRTPRVNRNAGRDHWGRLMSVVLSGGGLKVGQIVGRSNPKGEVPRDCPYRPEHVLAMVYRHLGIDPMRTFPDLSGRPRFLLEDRELIRELV